MATVHAERQTTERLILSLHHSLTQRAAWPFCSVLQLYCRSHSRLLRGVSQIPWDPRAGKICQKRRGILESVGARACVLEKEGCVSFPYGLDPVICSQSCHLRSPTLFLHLLLP